jgi:hypothetical protein
MCEVKAFIRIVRNNSVIKKFTLKQIQGQDLGDLSDLSDLEDLGIENNDNFILIDALRKNPFVLLRTSLDLGSTPVTPTLLNELAAYCTSDVQSPLGKPHGGMIVNSNNDNIKVSLLLHTTEGRKIFDLVDFEQNVHRKYSFVPGDAHMLYAKKEPFLFIDSLIYMSTVPSITHEKLEEFIKELVSCEINSLDDYINFQNNFKF